MKWHHKRCKSQEGEDCQATPDILNHSSSLIQHLPTQLPLPQTDESTFLVHLQLGCVAAPFLGRDPLVDEVRGLGDVDVLRGPLHELAEQRQQHAVTVQLAVQHPRVVAPRDVLKPGRPTEKGWLEKLLHSAVHKMVLYDKMKIMVKVGDLQSCVT